VRKSCFDLESVSIGSAEKPQQLYFRKGDAVLSIAQWYWCDVKQETVHLFRVVGAQRNLTCSPIIFHTSIGSEGHRGGVIPSSILGVSMVVEGRCSGVVALQEDNDSWETRSEEVNASSELGSAKPELYPLTEPPKPSTPTNY
jgi:hypothetical protein